MGTSVAVYGPITVRLSIRCGNQCRAVDYTVVEDMRSRTWRGRHSMRRSFCVAEMTGDAHVHVPHCSTDLGAAFSQLWSKLHASRTTTGNRTRHRGIVKPVMYPAAPASLRPDPIEEHRHRACTQQKHEEPTHHAGAGIGRVAQDFSGRLLAFDADRHLSAWSARDTAVLSDL